MSLKRCFKDDAKLEIGIDEAGRGSFWGPIMAGACIIPKENEWTDDIRYIVGQLKDSKKLSSKKRDLLNQLIRDNIPSWNVGIVTAEEINKYGITWANQEAFRRAVYGIMEGGEHANFTDIRLIIDGVLTIPDWNGELELIVEGDGEYLAIAAASILAKVEHDTWIQNYCKENSECNKIYDLAKSKGYGTKSHRDAIRIYGAHTLHRSVYIRNYLPGVPIIEKPVKKLKNNTKKGDCLIQFNMN